MTVITVIGRSIRQDALENHSAFAGSSVNRAEIYRDLTVEHPPDRGIAV